MKIWRIELGKWKQIAPDPKPKFFEINRCYSGCWLFTIGKFYLTILMGECYNYKREVEKDDIS